LICKESVPITLLVISAVGVSVLRVHDDPSTEPEIPSELLARFAVLRRPRPASAADAGADDAVTVEDHPLVERFGLIPTRTVEVRVAPGLDAWVIPGTRGACLRFRAGSRGGVSGAMGGVSGPLASVASRGLCAWVEALDGLHQTLYGLVPDGNDSVTVELVDGEQVMVSVVDNLYVLQSAVRLISVAFVNAAGEKELLSPQGV
jgi:hypothetical protein